jgi:hypothetical protein
MPPFVRRHADPLLSGRGDIDHHQPEDSHAITNTDSNPHSGRSRDLGVCTGCPGGQRSSGGA